MAIDVETARLTVYNAARLRDAGKPFLTEAAMCKLLASEVAERCASMAVNLFGGYGFTKDYPVEKLYRDAKIGQIYEGTTNMQLTGNSSGLTGWSPGTEDPRQPLRYFDDRRTEDGFQGAHPRW